MKTLILAGGYGSRLGNITENIPKPMVAIGGKPILWHIMKLYSHFGFDDFINADGYLEGVLIQSKSNPKVIIYVFQIILLIS